MRGGGGGNCLNLDWFKLVSEIHEHWPTREMMILQYLIHYWTVILTVYVHEHAYQWGCLSRMLTEYLLQKGIRHGEGDLPNTCTVIFTNYSELKANGSNQCLLMEWKRLDIHPMSHNLNLPSNINVSDMYIIRICECSFSAT